MSPTELRARCREAQEIVGRDDAEIPLTLRAGTRADRKTRRLFGRSGPIGRIVEWGYGGRDMAFFRTDQVLEWLERNLPTNTEDEDG